MARSTGCLRPEILAQISPLGLRAARVVDGTIAGLHRSPLLGLSAEFTDYRQYVHGDDLRRLDWRVYARSDRHYIKRCEEESNLNGTVLVDASASMKYGRGPMSKYDYAATLAASLAALLIRQHDAAGLALFDATERLYLPPSATKSQLTKIVDALDNARPERTTELGTVVTRMVDRFKRRGMVFVISDLLTDLDRFYEGLARLQAKGNDIVVLHVLDRDEIELPFDGSVLFRDIEGTDELTAEPWFFQKAYQRAMRAFRDGVEKRCRSCGMDYLFLTTDSDPGLALRHYLSKRLATRVGRGPHRTSSTRGRIERVRAE